MNYLSDLTNIIDQTKWVSTIIVILISFSIYRIIAHFLLNGTNGKKIDKKLSKKSKTYIKMISSILRYVFIIVTILIILQINGIDVSSILAGVGILSVIVGLAVQDALKDIIRGFNILSDDYFKVGDIVKYEDSEGKVLSLGLKTTKIQDLATSNIISIANRNIEKIEIVSNVIYVNIPMPYKISIEKAEKAVKEIIEKIIKNNNVKECTYKGVNNLDDSCIKYLIEINCNAMFKLQVRRDALRSILLGLEENNIEVPYNQIDVHLNQEKNNKI